ncbi:MAG: iron ABC transporter permease [Pseudomonadota bacterium]
MSTKTWKSPLARIFPLVAAGFVAALAFMTALHIAVGTVDMSLPNVIRALFGVPAEELHEQIVVGLRLPRALMAILAGAMLGTAGALLQIVTRNPLAEPGLLGVSGGAVLAIVIALVFDLGAETSLGLPLVGVLGGMAAGTTAYLLSLDRGTDPVRLVLVGVLIAGICSALTTIILIGADDDQVNAIVRWTVGSTNGRVWIHFQTILPYALIGLPAAFASASIANTLQLGDETARGLGQRVEGARLWLLLIAAFLTAGAVAVVGAVGLIGLIGPHMARKLTGTDARRLLPLSALLTGLLLLTADIIARTFELATLAALAGLEMTIGSGLPVGAVTALLGVPFFLWLLLRTKRSL